MSLVRDRLIQDLALAGYARSTQRVYAWAVHDFVRFVRRSPSELDQEDVRRWVHELSQSKVSPQRLRHHFAALRFLFTKTMHRPEVVSFLSWPAAPQRLPVVLGLGEIDRLLAELPLGVYRAFFTTMYATGLRMSEACRLETQTSMPRVASCTSVTARGEGSAWLCSAHGCSRSSARIGVPNGPHLRGCSRHAGAGPSIQIPLEKPCGARPQAHASPSA